MDILVVSDNQAVVEVVHLEVDRHHLGVDRHPLGVDREQHPGVGIQLFDHLEKQTATHMFAVVIS